MNIRFLLPAAVLMVSATVASAVDARARLLYKDGSQDDVLITKYSKGIVTYKANPQDLNRTRVGRSKYEAIYFYKPKIFADAMHLYHGRNYTEAKKKFAEVEAAFKNVDTAPNNYGTLAGFYKLECSRRLMDLDTLSHELTLFRSEGLTRETHRQQLELYALWEAVRLKDWERLDRLAQAWEKRNVPGSQRVQVAYCHGLALEHLAQKNPKRLTDALNAYNRVFSADFTASIEIVIAAANRLLNIYNTDPEVALAIKLWKTKDEDPNSTGRQRLLEANTLVKLYKQAGFNLIKPLDPAYTKFFKYEPPAKKNPTPPKDQKKPEAKKPAAKKPATKKKSTKKSPKNKKGKKKQNKNKEK